MTIYFSFSFSVNLYNGAVEYKNRRHHLQNN